MKHLLKFLIIAIAISQPMLAQKRYDPKLISKETELDLTKTSMRGFEANGRIYFIEKDLQTLTCYENGNLLWKTNVIKACGKPSVGKPKIRYIKRFIEAFVVIYGENNSIFVEVRRGKVDCKGPN
jgi:hypothetical protein